MAEPDDDALETDAESVTMEADSADISLYAVETSELVLRGAPESLEDVEAAEARRKAAINIAASVLVQAGAGADAPALLARRLAISRDEAEELIGSPECAAAARQQASMMVVALASVAQRKWMDNMEALSELASDGGVEPAIRVRAAASGAERAEKMLGMIAQKDGGSSGSSSSSSTVVLQAGFALPAIPAIPDGGIGLKKRIQ